MEINYFLARQDMGEVIQELGQLVSFGIRDEGKFKKPIALKLIVSIVVFASFLDRPCFICDFYRYYCLKNNLSRHSLYQHLSKLTLGFIFLVSPSVMIASILLP